MIFIFFGYLFDSYVNFAFLIIILSLLGIFFLFSNKKLKIDTNKFISISSIYFLILISIMGIAYTNFTINNINTLAFRIPLFIIGFFLIFVNSWQKIIIKYIYLGSLIHVLFTFLSFLFTNFFSKYIIIFFPGNIIDTYFRFLSLGVYSGITDQTGTNGYFISYAIMISFIYLITNNKKKNNINLLFFVLSVFAMLLTGKRGHFLASLISIFFVTIFYYRTKKKKFLKKILFITFILTLIIMFSLILIPDLQKVLVRYIPDDGDYTSGRINLYRNAIEMIGEKPILGWGGNTYGNIYGISVHNTYLQLFLENGVLAFLLFIFILLFNFMYTINFSKKVMLNNRAHDISLTFSLYFQLFFIIRNFIASSYYYNFVLIIYIISIAIPYSLKNINLRAD
jgi:O-antigen ligase